MYIFKRSLNCECKGQNIDMEGSKFHNSLGFKSTRSFPCKNYFSLHIFLTAEGHSIFVRNLPYDATVEQLKEEFKKFGPIKRDGIQVRSSKVWLLGYNAILYHHFLIIFL